jgi:hypothetical protein
MGKKNKHKKKKCRPTACWSSLRRNRLSHTRRYCQFVICDISIFKVVFSQRKPSESTYIFLEIDRISVTANAIRVFFFKKQNKFVQSWSSHPVSIPLMVALEFLIRIAGLNCGGEILLMMNECRACQFNFCTSDVTTVAFMNLKKKKK